MGGGVESMLNVTRMSLAPTIRAACRNFWLVMLFFFLCLEIFFSALGHGFTRWCVVRLVTGGEILFLPDLRISVLYIIRIILILNIIRIMY